MRGPASSTPENDPPPNQDDINPKIPRKTMGARKKSDGDPPWGARRRPSPLRRGRTSPLFALRGGFGLEALHLGLVGEGPDHRLVAELVELRLRFGPAAALGGELGVERPVPDGIGIPR